MRFIEAISVLYTKMLLYCPSCLPRALEKPTKCYQTLKNHGSQDVKCNYTQFLTRVWALVQTFLRIYCLLFKLVDILKEAANICCASYIWVATARMLLKSILQTGSLLPKCHWGISLFSEVTCQRWTLGTSVLLIYFWIAFILSGTGSIHYENLWEKKQHPFAERVLCTKHFKCIFI